jgi:hypothetical protein
MLSTAKLRGFGSPQFKVKRWVKLQTVIMQAVAIADLMTMLCLMRVESK